MTVVAKYRDLVVWQRAMDVVDHVYDEVTRWPENERFGLVGQTQRAAASIPVNIAEGQGRTGAKEFLHHLSIANGSLHELETLLQMSRAPSLPHCREKPGVAVTDR